MNIDISLINAITAFISVVAMFATPFITYYFISKKLKKEFQNQKDLLGKEFENQIDMKSLEERLKIYGPMATGLVDALSSSKADFKRFREDLLKKKYPMFFIYAPDPLIKKFNELLDLRFVKNHDDLNKEKNRQKLDNLCMEFILLLRKEIHPKTSLDLNDVRALINAKPDK